MNDSTCGRTVCEPNGFSPSSAGEHTEKNYIELKLTFKFHVHVMQLINPPYIAYFYPPLHMSKQSVR